MTVTQRLTPVIANDNDCFYDYLYNQYVPTTDFVRKLRSVELMYQSFDVSQCRIEFYDLVTNLQRNVGVNRTVWGVKKADGRIWWEFYWYNYRKGSALVSIPDVLKALGFTDSSLLGIRSRKPDSMFSIDVLPSFFENETLDHFYVYIPGYSNTSGVNYLLNNKGFTLENHYTFFNPLNDFEQIKSAIKRSIYLNFDEIQLHSILVPELIRCKSICISNKRNCDGIYYCGLNISQFLFFLKQYDYPPALVDLVERHSSLLDHLEFDVGFDYKMVEDNLQIVKSSYYGTF